MTKIWRRFSKKIYIKFKMSVHVTPNDPTFNTSQHIDSTTKSINNNLLGTSAVNSFVVGNPVVMPYLENPYLIGGGRRYILVVGRKKVEVNGKSVMDVVKKYFGELGRDGRCRVINSRGREYCYEMKNGKIVKNNF